MSTNFVPSNIDSSYTILSNNFTIQQNTINSSINTQIGSHDMSNNLQNTNIDYYIRKNIGWRRKSTNLHKFYPNS